MNLWTHGGFAGIFARKTGRYDPVREAVMAIPERFSNLPEYAFPRLRTLLSGLSPAADPVAQAEAAVTASDVSATARPCTRTDIGAARTLSRSASSSP